MADVFENISNAMADLVEESGKGIIRVEGRKRLAATGIAWREDVIVTAHHVLRRDDGIKVGLPDGSVVPASIVGRDKGTDIAVLKIDGGLTPLTIAEPGSARVGNLVLAIGKPGDKLQTTLGVVSAVGEGFMDGVLQTDVVMYPGFSGGPLIDASGKVQGMNTSGFRSGASITITSATINSVVDTLLQHGRVRKGYLGVGAQPVRLSDAIAGELNQETGLLVATVEKDSPAEKASMFQGDIIVALDGQATPHLDSLLMLLGGERVGKEVPVKLVRGGQIQEVNVTIGEKS